MFLYKEAIRLDAKDFKIPLDYVQERKGQGRKEIILK